MGVLSDHFRLLYSKRSMRKHFSIGLLLTTCLLASCQEAATISSPVVSGSDSSLPSESSDSSSFTNKTYHPIGPSSTTVGLFSEDVSFSLSTPTITKEQAEDLVNNDLLLFPEEQSLHKKTSIVSEREEGHVKENYRKSNYSVKDYFEEKHFIQQLDADNKWAYRKNVGTAKTEYFDEDDLIRHSIYEWLFYIKDGFYYEVHSEQSYYEGREDKGTYESYYCKVENSQGEDFSEKFALHLNGWTYFYGYFGFDEIDRSVFQNFRFSSSFYSSDHDDEMERHTSYEYHSPKSGSFGCVVEDDFEYDASDITDYPTGEKGILHSISYHQDYLLNISDYFTYDEDYITRSVSKKANGDVIRDETKEQRTKVTEECEVFYPDLSQFEEREYKPPVYR